MLLYSTLNKSSALFSTRGARGGVREGEGRKRRGEKKGREKGGGEEGKKEGGR